MSDITDEAMDLKEQGAVSVELQPLTDSEPSTTLKHRVVARSSSSWRPRNSRFMMATIFLLGFLICFTLLSSEFSLICTAPPARIVSKEVLAVKTSPWHPANASICSPDTLDAQAIRYYDKHRFYTMLQTMDPPFHPPVMKGEHMFLCDENQRKDEGWKYCLPISGRKDQPYCDAPDRMDLLYPHTPKTLCYGSVLHMLLVDVYDAFERLGGKPALLYGSMLGAIREGSTIVFTEDSDIGYQLTDRYTIEDVEDELWRKGYHLFRDNILRVCVAPTHPLASNLYDPERGLQHSYDIPYVDLYHMEQEESGKWRIDEAIYGRRIPNDKFQPYKPVKMNGLTFHTLADPVDFLEAEYGADFMVPHPRDETR